MDMPVSVNPSAKNISNERIQSLYRKPKKEEIKLMSPSPAVLEKYDEFLKDSNTGIFKLNGDSQCFGGPGVIVAAANCSLYQFPGAGTAYSFRVKSYRLHHLADLILDKDVIKTDGILQQGIMVNLGNVELNQITNETAGLKFLFDFKPAANRESYDKTNLLMIEGIKKDNFMYRFGFFATNETTFGLRSIAYRGKMKRSIDGVNYDEFDFDKRKDIVIVFRIVEKSENGDITILWKEISQKDSPVLNFEKGK